MSFLSLRFFEAEVEAAGQGMGFYLSLLAQKGRCAGAGAD